MIATSEGEKVVDAINREGIEATIIGKATDSNDRRLINGGEIRFLETPAKDELYQVIGGRE